MHKSEVYTQSVVCMQSTVCSPVFYRTLCIDTNMKCLFHWYAKQCAFITKTRQLLCLQTRLWILLLLWGNSYSSFSLPKQWNREHVGVPKQSCEVELFSFVNTLKWLNIICTMKSRPENETKHFLLWFILQKAALVFVEEKGVHNTQPNYSFLFVQKIVQISRRHVSKVFKCH